MTPTEYRAALTTLGLSQLAAGRWLSVSPKTAQNYASKGPSGPAARAVRLAVVMCHVVDEMVVCREDIDIDDWIIALGVGCGLSDGSPKRLDPPA